MPDSFQGILNAVNVTALAAFAVLLALGKLVPVSVVKEYMLTPLNDRIAALERISAKRDDQNAELQRMQAEAIKAQSQALELIHSRRT